jgi:hypothetical protein
MNYQDVTAQIRKSSRVTDCLNPLYPMRDTMNGDITRAKYGEVNRSYGPVQGSKPSDLTKEVRDQKGLGTGDINGAQAGSKNRGMFTWKAREQF